MKVRSTRFLHYLTNMNFVVIEDDGDDGYPCAAFNCKPDVQEWIACQDNPSSFYYVHEEGQ